MYLKRAPPAVYSQTTDAVGRSTSYAKSIILLYEHSEVIARSYLGGLPRRRTSEVYLVA